MKKKLIIVAAPPACGKTVAAKYLAAKLAPVVYLDKDDLLPLAHQVFVALGEKVNRSGPTHAKYLRDAEGDVTLDLAINSLAFCDCAIVNAPYTRELRLTDPRYVEKMQQIRARLDAANAELVVVFIQSNAERAEFFMRERQKNEGCTRDEHKLADAKNYFASIDYSVPQGLRAYTPAIFHRYHVVENLSTTEQLQQNLNAILDDLRA